MLGGPDIVAWGTRSGDAPAPPAGALPARQSAREFLARTFHGLTWRRVATLALFGLALSLFNWPVALTYARGLPASQVALAFVQTYLGATVWFAAGMLAALAAYNRVRGSPALRLGVTAVAIGVAVGMAQSASLAIRNAPLRDVLVHVVNAPFLWFQNCVIVAFAAAALLYMTRSEDAERLLEAEARRALDLDRAVDEARLQATQAQIEPHFLFNTIANIRRLYEVDRSGARTMLRQFSQMLGRSLADIRSTRSTLEREVALALAYLSVQQIRMGDRLEVATDIPPALLGAALPPMMLSTLVENAIKHGVAPLPGGGRVTICAHAEGDVLHVRVVDNGRGFGESSGSGVGLANIETRLAALFGRAAGMSLEPNETGGVTAHLELPLRFEVPDADDARSNA